MNPLIQLKKGIALAVFVLVCLGPVSQVRAVSPAPDECYPNFTTAEGCEALKSLTMGAGNTALGWRSLFSDSTGSFSTAVGVGALALNNADSNTAIGAAALLLNTTGSDNTAIGSTTLVHNDSGSHNIAIGDDTLSNNVSGSFNIVVGGFGAGFNIVSGSNNIYIGPGVSANGPFDESDTIRINDSAPAAGGATSQVFFAGIHGSTVGAVNSPVLVNPNGQPGTAVSSARFKKDIDPIGKTSEAIFSLRPVTFHYKGDTTNTPQFGLIAEEVAQVSPALVLLDKDGKPYSVRYEHINAMLLNEFLKEHREFLKEHKKLQDLETTVGQQQKGMEILTAQLKEQAAQIQKISARVEAGKSVPRVVANEP